MAKRDTLASLRSEVARLLQCCDGYKEIISAKDQEIDVLKASVQAIQSQPSAFETAQQYLRSQTQERQRSTEKVNKMQQIVDQLTTWKPFSKEVCPVHGGITANKHGHCNHCYNHSLGKPNRTYSRQN